MNMPRNAELWNLTEPSIYSIYLITFAIRRSFVWFVTLCMIILTEMLCTVMRTRAVSIWHIFIWFGFDLSVLCFHLICHSCPSVRLVVANFLIVRTNSPPACRQWGTCGYPTLALLWVNWGLFYGKHGNIKNSLLHGCFDLFCGPNNNIPSNQNNSSKQSVYWIFYASCLCYWTFHGYSH